MVQNTSTNIVERRVIRKEALFTRKSLELNILMGSQKFRSITKKIIFLNRRLIKSKTVQVDGFIFTMILTMI